MSKAFTRESDDAQDLPVPSRQPVALPPGGKNYFTPDGMHRLRTELQRLIEVERPRAAGAVEAGDRRRKFQTLEHRIWQLEQSLQSAIIVPRPPRPWEQVHFGATVTVREAAGSEARYRIVGVDEADPGQDWVSWCSPIARALLNARIGQRVRFRVPAGEQELEILAISYE